MRGELEEQSSEDGRHEARHVAADDEHLIDAWIEDGQAGGQAGQGPLELDPIDRQLDVRWQLRVPCPGHPRR